MALGEEISTGSPSVVVLYGSHARGDSDCASDLDILVVGAANQTYRVVPQHSRVTEYSWSELREMQSYGSLFLRHLQSEGRILEGNPEGVAEYGSLISDIPRYGRAASDLVAFHRTLDDCESAILIGDTSLEFELACIATT